MARGKALFDNALYKAHVDIAAGEDADHVLALHVDFAVEHSGDRRRARRLYNHLAALHEKQDRAGNLGVGHRDHAVAEAVDDIHGDIAGLLDRDSVGDGGGCRGADQALFAEALGDGVRALGLYAVDFYAGIDLLDCCRNPCQQPAAARRCDDNIHRCQIAQDLETQRALSRDDLKVVIGMQESSTLVLTDFAGLGVGLVIA